MAVKYILALVFLPGVVLATNPLSSYEVLFSWKSLDFAWPTPESRQELLASGQFIPENNVITGIKVFGSKIFLTVPRWKLGVPSTLNVVDLEGSTNGAPALQPFPSWHMQQVGNCSALQYTQSMEIDRFGRMWAVDVGRVDIFKNSVNFCKAKIVLIDIQSGEVVHAYEFPEEVVNPASNFLNDVVVECEEDNEDNCFAYITDAKDAKLVVFSLKEGRSWHVRHPSMQADLDANRMEILGGNYSFNVNIDGIALSPKSSGHDRVYYCPLTSYALYSVATSILKESVNGVTLSDKDVTTHTNHRSSQADGLAMDANGLLFYGLLQNNSVVYVNTSAPVANTTDPFAKEVLLIHNDVDLQWPDTFAFDEQGYLYTVSNRIQRFTTGTMDWSEVNFRVARVFVGSLNYQYGRDEKVEKMEASSSTEDSVTNPTNLDNNAPDTPIGVQGKDIYKLDEPAVGQGNDLGSGDHGVGHHHDHQHGDLHGTTHSTSSGAGESSSSPTSVSEHLPVVLFLCVLMYNPALRP